MYFSFCTFTKSQHYPLLPSPFDLLSAKSDSRLKGKRLLVRLSNSLDVSVFVAPPGVGLLYHESYLDFDDWYFMQRTNCASFMPGLLAIAKLSSKHTDQFKHADIGFVEDCFLCTPQYIFQEGGNINYGIKCLKKDSLITL